MRTDVLQSPDLRGGRSPLFELLGADEARFRKVILEFHRTALCDLHELDAAVRTGDGVRVRTVAHRVAMACYLVGERPTGVLLESLARSGQAAVIDPVMTQCLSRARMALVASIAWASQCVHEPPGEI